MLSKGTSVSFNPTVDVARFVEMWCEDRNYFLFRNDLLDACDVDNIGRKPCEDLGDYNHHWAKSRRR